MALNNFYKVTSLCIYTVYFIITGKPYKYTNYLPYSSKFLWSNISMIFMNYTEITKSFSPKNFLTAPLSTGLETLKS